MVQRELVSVAQLGNAAGSIMIGHASIEVEEDIACRHAERRLPPTAEHRGEVRRHRGSATWRCTPSRTSLYEEIPSARSWRATTYLFCSTSSESPPQRYLSSAVSELKVHNRFDEAWARQTSARTAEAFARPPAPATWNDVVERAERFIEESSARGAPAVIVPDRSAARTRRSREPAAKSGRGGAQSHSWASVSQCEYSDPAPKASSLAKAALELRCT